MWGHLRTSLELVSVLCGSVHPRSLAGRNVALYWDSNLIFYSSKLAKNVSAGGSVSNILGRK